MTNKKDAGQSVSQKTLITGGDTGVFDFDYAIRRAERQFCPICTPSCAHLAAAMPCASCRSKQAKADAQTAQPPRIKPANTPAALTPPKKANKIIKLGETCSVCRRSFATAKYSNLPGVCLRCCRDAQGKTKRGQANFQAKVFIGWQKILREAMNNVQ